MSLKLFCNWWVFFYIWEAEQNNQKKLASITLNKRIVKYHHQKEKFHLLFLTFYIRLILFHLLCLLLLLGFIILKVYLADMSEIYIFFMEFLSYLLWLYKTFFLLLLFIFYFLLYDHIKRGNNSFIFHLLGANFKLFLLNTGEFLWFCFILLKVDSRWIKAIVKHVNLIIHCDKLWF